MKMLLRGALGNSQFFSAFLASLVGVGCVVSDVEVGPEVPLLILDGVHRALQIKGNLSRV